MLLVCCFSFSIKYSVSWSLTFTKLISSYSTALLLFIDIERVVIYSIFYKFMILQFSEHLQHGGGKGNHAAFFCSRDWYGSACPQGCKSRLFQTGLSRLGCLSRCIRQNRWYFFSTWSEHLLQEYGRGPIIVPFNWACIVMKWWKIFHWMWKESMLPCYE